MHAMRAGSHSCHTASFVLVKALCVLQNGGFTRVLEVCAPVDLVGEAACSCNCICIHGLLQPHRRHGGAWVDRVNGTFQLWPESVRLDKAFCDV